MNLPPFFTDNTAGILTRRSTFTHHDRILYHLPMVITDSGSPALSSTATFTISVCVCQSTGRCPSSGMETLALSIGVSMQALLGISICLITVIGMIYGLQYEINLTKSQDIIIIIIIILHL